MGHMVRPLKLEVISSLPFSFHCKTFSLIGENVVCNAMAMKKLFFKSMNGDAGINFTGKEDKSVCIIMKINNCPLMMEGI